MAYDFINEWRKSTFVHVQKEGHRKVRIRTQVLIDANTPESGQVGQMTPERGRPTFRAILTSGVNLDGFLVDHFEKFWIVGVEFTTLPPTSILDRLQNPIL